MKVSGADESVDGDTQVGTKLCGGAILSKRFVSRPTINIYLSIELISGLWLQLHIVSMKMTMMS